MSLPSLVNLSLTPAAAIGMPVGEKRKQKRSRTVASGLVKLLPTQNVGSLDANGVASLTIPESIDTAAFLTLLREATNTWFQTNLQLMLQYGSHERGGKHLSPMFYSEKNDTLYTEIIAAHKKWDAELTEEQKLEYQQKIDLRTDEGMQLVFDPDYLRKRPWFKAMPGNAFFLKAVSFVKMGNTGMGLANMAGGWTNKGFGKWAHLIPDVALPMVAEAMKLMATLGLKPGLPQHFPHLIYKPPKGAALEIHHDQMTPPDLIANLRAHVASPNPSTTAWVKKHGAQMLAQLKGGSGIEDGATLTVGPLTPAALLVCMDAFKDGRVGGKHVEWLAKTKGPYFLDWEEHIDQFNTFLQAAGHPSIGLIPATPQPSTGGGFICVWPVGWPHGSFANSKNENRALGQGSRVTITIPVTIRDSSQIADARIPERLRNMATLSSNGLSSQQYGAAEEWISKDLKVYADGPTHTHPERVANLIRSLDASKALGYPEGPYASVVVKPDTVEKYIAVLARVKAEESLLGTAAAAGEAGPSGTAPEPMELDEVEVEEDVSSDDDVPPVKQVRTDPPPPPPTPAPAAPMAEARPTGARAPPTAAVLDIPTMMVVKVVEPWATAIVKGQKDVENRRNRSQPKLGNGGDWVLIAASKPAPKPGLMADYIRRIQTTEPNADEQLLASQSFASRAIVGIAHIKGVYGDGKTPAQLPWPSPWYNENDFAWVFSDAWQFETPVKLSDNDGFQTNALLRNLEEKFGYKARIIEELGKLKYGER